jgi:hypothetical protein
VPRSLLVALLLAPCGVLACGFPTDQSSQLTVRLDSVPDLFLKDSLRLSARVVNAAGDSIPGGVVTFTSSDPTVLNVTPSGQGLATGVGTATLSANALAFAGAAPATAQVHVHGLLEIDSIRPAVVRFGDSLHVYGVGLNPDSLLTMSLGGEDLTAAQYVPADPAKPQRWGRLSLWVRAPAERFSLLTLVGFAGGAVFPDTIGVLQRDRYEPNDTVPSALGAVATFYNPALAFEAVGRSDTKQPADWYTFTNTAPTDRTIIVSSDFVGAAAFSTFVTDSLAWDGASSRYVVGPKGWTVGPQTYLCDGKSVTQAGTPVAFKEQAFPISIVALANLPVGTFHVIVPFVASAQPKAYQLVITSTYESVLPRDVAEENDYCDVAAPLAVTAGAKLTIDNPHDIDWYKFSVTTVGVMQATVTAGPSVSPNLPTPDLDLYLIRDFRPDSLVLVQAAATEGSTETLSAAVVLGNYFLVVTDYAGSPTSYTLTTSIPPAPPLAAPQTQGVRKAHPPAPQPAGAALGAALRAAGVRLP